MARTRNELIELTRQQRQARTRPTVPPVQKLKNDRPRALPIGPRIPKSKSKLIK